MPSRKFKALQLGAVCYGFVILLAFVLVTRGQASAADFFSLVKVLAGILATGVTSYMGTQAYEDVNSKGKP
jgi:hypothetical protein